MHTHHAYLTYGTSPVHPAIPSAFHIESIDVMHVVKDILTIGDVRRIIDEASRTPFASSHRTFVLCVREIAYEAQHALLKILEEPPATAQFYLVVPRTARILPTVLSRLSLREGVQITEDTQATGKAFLDQELALQLQQIADKTKDKDTVWIETILVSCEQYAQEYTLTDLLRCSLNTSS
jgi:DNA polymerase III delta prime subunit